MDDESTKLLGQLVDLQREQTELCRKYLPPLWARIRFSLLALLILTEICRLASNKRRCCSGSACESRLSSRTALNATFHPSASLMLETRPGFACASTRAGIEKSGGATEWWSAAAVAVIKRAGAARGLIRNDDEQTAPGLRARSMRSRRARGSHHRW
jgi:hypothetical protein